MRLLNTQSLELRDFNEKKIPSYCILSHTWEEDEVLFEDMRDVKAAKQKAGFKKVQQCCDKVLEAGFTWVWIDTCCIQKSSSAELSEAINSMYKWYKDAHMCFAYLFDIRLPLNQRTEIHEAIDEQLYLELQKCRWFTRGWTLQEMLAPKDLIFCDHEWNYIGSKAQLSPYLSVITGVDRSYMLGKSLTFASIAQRMSWAASRQTSRMEDIAYCLMGIFDVNMPLLYGEGRKAFIRLQEEIIRNSTDQSLFAWRTPSNLTRLALSGPLLDDEVSLRGILARSPSEFQFSRAIVPISTLDFDETFSITNKGLMIKLPLIPISGSSLVRAALACRVDNDFKTVVAITLSLVGAQSLQSTSSFLRAIPANFERVSFDEKFPEHSTQLFILTDFQGSVPKRNSSGVFTIATHYEHEFPGVYRLTGVYPQDQWNPQKQRIETVRGDRWTQVAALQYGSLSTGVIVVVGFVDLQCAATDPSFPFCNIVAGQDIDREIPLEDLISRLNLDKAGPGSMGNEFSMETTLCVVKVKLHKWGDLRNHFLADITFSKRTNM